MMIIAIIIVMITLVLILEIGTIVLLAYFIWHALNAWDEIDHTFCGIESTFCDIDCKFSEIEDTLYQISSALRETDCLIAGINAFLQTKIGDD